jgi:hypothetical protein
MVELLLHTDCSTCRSILPAPASDQRPQCSRHGRGVRDPLGSVCRDWIPVAPHASAPDGLRWLLQTLAPWRLFEIHGAYEAFVEITDLAPAGDDLLHPDDPDGITF